MIRRPPKSTRTDTLFPDTTLFRSQCGKGPDRGAVAEQRHGVVRSVCLDDRPDRRVVAGEELVARCASRHPEIEIADQPVADALDVGAHRIAVRAHLDVAGGDLIQSGLYDDLEATRSDERRVGQECVSTCRSRWSP